MGRLIIPILLLILAFGSYFLYTQPIYGEAKEIKAEVAKLKDADAKLTLALQKKDKLSATFNSLDTALIARLEKLMPDNLDNIKLIIDVDRAAKQYGMVLNGVKFDVDQQAKQEAQATTRVSSEGTSARDNKAAAELKKDYNNFSLTMTVSGTFDNFTKLMADMEKNLRLIDITSVTFDAQDANRDVYKYEIKAKIYWLKPAATK